MRLSNLPARRLYEKYGFKPVGLRPRYYSDDGEDALIMTTEALTGPATRSGSPACAPSWTPHPLRSTPTIGSNVRARSILPVIPTTPTAAMRSGSMVLAIESSCDETGIALIEDGRTIHANVVASQVALHAASGGIVPEVAARAHLRWIIPVLDEAWADADAAWSDVDAVTVTDGPGLAGSLLVGVNLAKALAWVHEKPLIGVNHLEGHVYAAWLADRGGPTTPSRSSRSSRWSFRAATRSSPR